MDVDEVISKISEYSEFVDALVISGGEPLLQADEVEAVLGHARGLGLKTKLDTNGSYPGKLMRLIPLLDYVAVDVKAPPVSTGDLPVQALMVSWRASGS